MKRNIIGKAITQQIKKPGTKQNWFTLRFIIFDPEKHFVSTDEAKELWRKESKISKQKMKDEFISVFATAEVVGRGKTKHLEFNKTTKNAANTIFIVPTKWRREAYKEIQNLEVYPEFLIPFK